MIDMDRLDRWSNVLLKLELHAVLMLAVGCLLAYVGHKDEGSLVIGGALAAFRGGRTAN